MRDELIEPVARALCEEHIRRVRLWDTPPDELEAMIGRSVDYAWSDFTDRAQAAVAVIEARGMLAQGWRDIESAPRDGTSILVWTTTREPHYDDQRYIETICQRVHVEEVQSARWIEEDGEWEQHYIGTPCFGCRFPPPRTQPQRVVSDDPRHRS